MKNLQYCTSRGNFVITWNIKYAYHISEKSKFFADYEKDLILWQNAQTQAKQMGTFVRKNNITVQLLRVPYSHDYTAAV